MTTSFAPLLPQPAAVSRIPRALSNLVLCLAFTLPVSVALKAIAMAITQGASAVKLDAVLQSFSDPYMLVTIAMFPVVLLVEGIVLGWERSTMRKLAVQPTQDAQNDVFFFLFLISGAGGALITIFSAGLVDAALALLQVEAYHGPLEGLSVWLQVPLLYLAMNFANYWSHRLMHSRVFWPMHAIHHVTTDFTVLDMTRVSLVEVLIGTVFLSIAVAALDGGAEAITLATFIFLNDSLFLHSDLPGLYWLERFGLNPPRAHRVHHGLDERYRHCNYGSLLCVWDVLFGTYISPRDAEQHRFEIGIEDAGFRYDTSSMPLLPWLSSQWQWLRGLPRMLVPVRG